MLSIDTFIGIVGICLTCFSLGYGLGYTIGKTDNTKK